MKILWLCALLPLISFGQLKGKVVQVKDGDTVVILDEDNQQHVIRVADIDCPEYAQPFSKVAKRFTSDEIYLKLVFVEEKGKDRYGRIIGFINYDSGKNLSEELLKKGLAWHFKKYSTNSEFSTLESLARQMNIGIWTMENPIAPWIWRRNYN
ncbi:nuclease [Flagellimonas hymeniacidonis]|uniref:Nuclease n=1 Tax=Flagellimonas hymeniacidonis TaxID=2603628 RepID=A0A5C8V739_9FLAO|nr:thermonuclease family protein [Flagellimonas hymeniacidonis]TXN37725.1 nuclease [Flagellimonas hymeniacidonis]